MSGPKPTWKIINRGTVPDPAPNTVAYTCMGCMREADLPVVGLAIAQVDSGLVFDVGPMDTPRVIQCRHCRRRFELEAR